MRRNEEIQGEPRCTAAIAEFLRKAGGTNPFGDPNYRLVHTTTRHHMQGGAWKEWPEGLSLQEKGGMVTHEPTGLMIPSLYRPIRVAIEMRWVHKYEIAFKGWVLERWMPAAFYGSQASWNGLTLPNHKDIQLLGPYPAEGDYEPCSAITPNVPGLDDMKDAINYQTWYQENLLVADVQQRIRDRITAAAEAYQKQQESDAKENEYRIKNFLSPWTSGSLEAGRWRSDAAARAGVKEHAGN